MANNEFLDALSPEAEKRLKSYHSEVMKLITDIGKVNTMQIGAKPPSGTDSAIKQLTDALNKQDAAVLKLQNGYANLAEAQKKKIAGNVQERVDNSILLQQEKQQATIISEVAGAYRKLSAEVNKAGTNVQNIIARGKLATQTQRQFNAELRIAQTEFNALNKRVLAADAAVGRWNRTGTRTIEGAKELASSLGVVFGIAGVGLLAKSIFDTTKELQSLDLALKSVTGSEQQFANEQQFLTNIAEKYGLEIKNLTSLYTSFYVSAKDKLAGEQIQQIFEDIAKSGSALGLSNDALTRSFTAINQMLSKGTVSAEELRGQLAEALPGSVQALLRAVQKLNPEIKNLTEKGLFQMIKDGKILANEVLPEMSKQLLVVTGADKAEGINTLSKATNRLTNSWTEFVSALNSGDGLFSTAIVGLIEKLSEAVKGAAILLESNESARAKELKAIRQASYEDELAYYKSLEKIDEAEIARKKIVYLEQIKILQDQVKANNEANREILNAANNNQYIKDAPAILKENAINTKALNMEIKSYYGRIAAGTELLKKSNKVQNEKVGLTDKERKALENLREEAIKNNFLRQVSDLERQKFLIEQRLEDEAKYADDKVELSNMIYQKERAILSLQLFENLRLHSKSLDLQLIDRNNFRTADEKAEKENQERILKIKTDAYNEYREYVEKYGRKADEEQFGTGTNFLPTEDLDKMLADWKDFKAKQVEADNEATEKIKQNINDYVRSFSKSFFGDAGLSTLFDIMTDKIDGFGKDTKTTILAVTEAFQEMYNLMAEASKENFDRQYQYLERKKEIEILFAGESDAAREQIEKQYEQRKRVIQERELKAQKEIARFNVLINTAQAVVSALATTPFLAGLALAGVAAAAGAVQLSAINAQQIPQYWKGTENHAGGLMMVNDRGLGSELIQTPDGKNYIAKGKDVIVNAPKGTKVKTADQTALMFDQSLNGILNERGILSQSNSIVAVDNSGVISEIKNLTTAVLSQSNDVATFDRLGMSIFNVRNGARQKQVGNRLRIQRNG